jgi:3-oxoacyl-[acyl-carrier protein] reductase
MSFAGRVAAVSGAGGPMGAAVIDRLVTGGIAGLALTDISGRRLEETRAQLPTDLPVVAVRGDVTVEEEADAFGRSALETFGRVDILINVVGGIRSNQLYTPVMEITVDQWRATFDLNILGTMHLVRAFAPGMLARKWGRIVNFTSIVFGGEQGQADYAAAKAAVASLTRSLAEEFAPDVTVNCVAPGLTRTSITENMPLTDRDRLVGRAFNRRMAEPSETADAVAYFLTDAARFVTGEMLSVSGGVRPHL